MTIIHVHIPKSGGTSLLQCFNEVYNVDRLSNKGGFRNFKYKPQFNLISGHMPYIELANVPNPKYITFLRDPIERLLSFYYYVKGRPKSIWYKPISHMNLHQFLKSNLHDNEMTRFIAGLDDIGLVNKSPITELHLELAKTNLAKFTFVGILERGLQVELDRMGDELEWETTPIVGHWLKSKNPGTSKLPDKHLSIATAKTSFDKQLYDYSLSL